MSRISGVGGNCSINGYSIQFRDWSAQFTAADIDVTGFTDTHTRHLAGIQGGTFNASGTLNAGGGGPSKHVLFFLAK